MEDLEILKTTLEGAQSLLILTAQNPELDTVAASLSLYLALKDAGKNVVIASSTAPIVRDSHLVGLDQITDSIGNQNLIVSLPYQEDSIEKVSYNQDDQRFNLIIQPKKGFPPIKKEDLTFTYSGAAADAIIVVGASRIEDVGHILDEEKELLETATLINISNKQGANFGKANFVDPQSSLSEIVTALVQEMSLPLNVDIANNLLLGIEEYTDNLQSPTITADTFEALAILYRAGARRRIRAGGAPQTQTQQPVQSEEQSIPTKEQPVPVGVSGETQQDQSATPEESSGEAPSPDWMGPKIFRGGSGRLA